MAVGSKDSLPTADFALFPFIRYACITGKGVAQSHQDSQGVNIMSKSSFFNGATVLFILVSIITIVTAISGNLICVIAAAMSVVTTLALLLLTNHFDKKERRAFQMELIRRYNP